MQPLTITQIVALVVVSIGLAIDWRTTKIPNWLTFPGAACGLALNWFNNGATGALYSIEGWCIGSALMLIVSYLPIGSDSKKPKLGMGDVKLLAAMGAFLGPRLTLLCFFYFCLVYGLISIFLILRAIPFKQLGLILFLMLGGQSKAPTLNQQKLTEVRKKPIPIGLAIGMGTLLAILLEQQTLIYLGFG